MAVEGKWRNSKPSFSRPSDPPLSSAPRHLTKSGYSAASSQHFCNDLLIPNTRGYRYIAVSTPQDRWRNQAVGTPLGNRIKHTMTSDKPGKRRERGEASINLHLSCQNSFASADTASDSSSTSVTQTLLTVHTNNKNRVKTLSETSIQRTPK